MKVKLFVSESLYFFKSLISAFHEIKYAWQLAFYSKETFDINGVKLIIDREVISANILKSIFKKNYELGENNILRKVLQPGDKLLEIGAGMGYNSIAAAQILGDHRVVSYEANPKLIEIIKNNFKVNSVQVELKNVILANDEISNEVKFYLSQNFWESSLLQGELHDFVYVKTTNFLKEINEHRPNAILCDIEGGEIDLFNIKFPDFIHKIILDTHPFFSAVGDIRNSNLIYHLLSQGFILNSTINHGYVYYFERK